MLSTLGQSGTCKCGREMKLYSGDYKWWGCGKCNALSHDCKCETLTQESQS